MKKTLALIFALIMVVCSFAACTDDTNESGDSTTSAADDTTSVADDTTSVSVDDSVVDTYVDDATSVDAAE